MSEMKHTPGPWLVDGPLHNQIVWSSPLNRICFLAHSNGCKPEQDAANGRLIAAAPDLLDALVNLLAAYGEKDKQLCCNGHECGCQGATVHSMAEHYARAAIAKAGAA